MPLSPGYAVADVSPSASDWLISTYIGSRVWITASGAAWLAVTSAPRVTLERPMRPLIGALTRVKPSGTLAPCSPAWAARSSACACRSAACALSLSWRLTIWVLASSAVRSAFCRALVSAVWARATAACALPASAR